MTDGGDEPVKKAAALFTLFAVFVGVAAATPLTQDRSQLLQQYTTDTITVRENVTVNANTSDWTWEEGGSTYLFKVTSFSTDYTYHSDGTVKDVEITAELHPNNITRLLDATKQPWKDIAAGKHDTWDNRTHYFNHHYYWNGSDISQSQMDALVNEIDSVPVYGNGDLVKTVNMKDSPKNVTAKIKLRNGTGDVGSMTIGNNSAVFSVSTQTNWNDGTFNGTSADRADNSGDLGIGYLNGTTTNDLKGLWRLDTTTSGATDYSGNGNDGTLANSPAQGATGVWDTNAYDFENNNGDHVSISDSSSLNGEIDDEVTISVWTKYEGGAASNARLFSLDNRGGNGIELIKDNFVNSDDSMVCSLTVGGVQYDLDTPNAIPTGEWTNYVCKYNGTHVSLWQNGTLKDNETASGTVTTKNDPACIGTSSDGSSCTTNAAWDGVIDEVGVWNVSKDAEKLYRWGTDTLFDAEHNSTTFSVPAGERPVNLTVNSTNIDASGNETWATVRTDNGESDTVQLATGSTEQNYSLSFSSDGGTAWVDFNVTSDSPVGTPIVRSFDLYTADTSGGGDTTAPTITIDDPQNATLSDATPPLNYYGDETLDYCKYNVDSNTNTSLPNCSNTTLSSLTDGGHDVTVWANDTAGNWGSSQRYFTVDTTAPNVAYQSSTTSAGTIAPNHIFINISASDALGLDWIRETFDGVNSSFANSGGGYYWENHTGLTDGQTYTLQGWANDSGSNYNFTAERSITINSAPNITNLSVSPDPVDTGQTVNITADITDSENNGDSQTCVLKDANGNVEVDNVSMSSTGTDEYSCTTTPAEESSNIGDWSYTLYANDTEGASAASSSTFMVEDAGSPTWQNVQDDHSDPVYPNQTISITSDFHDIGSGLNTSRLATNETGFMQNKSNTSLESTAVFTGEDGTLNGSAYGFTFADSGARLYSVDINNNRIHQYNLSDPYNVSSLTRVEYLDISYTPYDVAVGKNGKRLYASTAVDNDYSRHYQYKLSDSYNVSSATLQENVSGTALGESSIGRTPNGIAFGKDGRRYYHTGIQTFYMSNLSEAWNISSSNLNEAKHDFNVSGLRGLTFDPSGTTLVVAHDETPEEYLEYELSEPWNTSTAELQMDENMTVNYRYPEDVEFANKTRLVTFKNDDDTVRKLRLWASYSLRGPKPNATEQAAFEWANGSFSGFFGYKIYGMDAAGNWNVTATGSFLSTYNPSYTNQKVVWNNVSGTETRQLKLTINDSGETDISSHSSPPSGSEGLFSNATLRIDGWTTGAFDWLANVTDKFGRTSPAYGVNYTTTDNGLQEDDYSHSLSTQQINRSVTVDNRGPNSLDYDITLYDEGTVVVDGNASGTIAAGGSVSTTEVWSGDWLSGVTEGTYIENQNSSKSSDIDTQYIYNQTNLTVTNSKSFPFSSVNLSSQCSIDTAADVPAGTSEVTQRCNNATFSGDWLSETEFGFAPQKDEVTLGVDYLGDRVLKVANSKSVGFTGINVTSAVTLPKGCSQTNNTAVDIGSSATTNYTVEMKCDPGSVAADLTQVTDADANNDTWYWMNSTSLNITTNQTENTTVTVKYAESELNDWDSRKGGYEEIYCNGQKLANATFEDPSNTVKIKYWSNSSCGSSLTTATSSIGFKYEVGESDTTTVSESSSSTGGGQQQPDDLGAELLPSTPYLAGFGENVTRTLTVRNYKNVENRVDLSIDPRPGDACQYIRIQSVTKGRVEDSGRLTFNTSGGFTTSGLVRIPPASAGLTGSDSEIPVPLQITMPDEETFDRVKNENGTISCRLKATVTNGLVNDVVIEVKPQTNPFTGLFVRGNQLLLALIDALMNTFSTTEQTCFGENNTALLTNGTEQCPESARKTRQMPTPAGWMALITGFGIVIAGLIHRYR